MTLDAFEDRDCDTLLHLAVQTGSVEVTRELLKHGAKTHVCNRRGDTPFQFYFFPRFSKAARLCRAAYMHALVSIEEEALGHARDEVEHALAASLEYAHHQTHAIATLIAEAERTIVRQPAQTSAQVLGSSSGQNAERNGICRNALSL